MRRIFGSAIFGTATLTSVAAALITSAAAFAEPIQPQADLAVFKNGAPGGDNATTAAFHLSVTNFGPLAVSDAGAAGFSAEAIAGPGDFCSMGFSAGFSFSVSLTASTKVICKDIQDAVPD